MNWCAVINKILRGTDIVRLQNRNLPKIQKMALEKFNKKLKNKKISKEIMSCFILSPVNHLSP